MKPPRSILDPAFKYVNAASTDVAKTFARVRKEMTVRERVEPPAPTNVKPLKRA